MKKACLALLLGLTMVIFAGCGDTQITNKTISISNVEKTAPVVPAIPDEPVYDFVKVPINSSTDYRNIIKEKASQGWRFVKVFSPNTGFKGCAEYRELVFSNKEILEAQKTGTAFTPFEYDFATVKIREDYRSITGEKAKQGWNLVEILSPGTGIYGSSENVEMVFEKGRK